MTRKNPVFAYPSVFKEKKTLLIKCCEVCNKRLERNTTKSGEPERIENYNRRKTCSRECRRIYISGDRNPNYKGKMPHCLDCGKKIGYATGKGNPIKRCRDCFDKWAEATRHYYLRPQYERLKKYQYRLVIQ